MTSDFQTANAQHRYRAFISYSRKDKVFARRLHKALEAYRLPDDRLPDDRLPGGKTADGIGRIFRDDDEMAAAADIGASIRSAIEASSCLIVICSPRSAQSRWVNREIEHFRKTGRAEHVFAVIIDGAPNSGNPETECFPAAFRTAAATSATLEELPAAPLAVDCRQESFSHLRARLAAGLLDVPFDDLWRRDQRRRKTQKTQLFFLAGAVIALIGAFTLPAIVNKEIGRALISSRLTAAQENLTLSPRAQSQLRALIASSEQRLAQVANDGLAILETGGGDAGDMWGVSQAVAAITPDEELFARFDAAARNTVDDACACWRFNNRGLIPISFWVLEAYSDAGAPAPRDAVDALLRAQGGDGAWPAHFEQVEKDEAASLYVTAMLVLALERQRMVTPQTVLAARIDHAAEKGAAWLSSKAPDKPHQWADYPDSNRSVSDSMFGGMALAALAASESAAGMAPIARSWIESFDLAHPDAYISSDTPLEFTDGVVSADLYRHIPFSWNLIGVVSSWPALDLPAKIEAIEKMQRALKFLTDNPGVFEREWVAADILYALHVLERATTNDEAAARR